MGLKFVPSYCHLMAVLLDPEIVQLLLHVICTGGIPVKTLVQAF